MLRLRVATRASVLTAHVRQLDSAVNLREHPDRLHGDSDRSAPGVRTVVGPETRSLLRQLLASRDVRVQQQLVREIRHQLQKRVLAALKRARAVEKLREQAVRAARAAGRSGGLLIVWFRGSAGRARTRLGGRTTRVVGNRKPAARTRATAATRARTPASARTREPAAARTRKPAERGSRPRATGG
jgi:hypothetical protein